MQVLWANSALWLLLQPQLLGQSHGGAQEAPPQHGSQRYRHSVANLLVTAGGSGASKVDGIRHTLQAGRQTPSWKEQSRVAAKLPTSKNATPAPILQRVGPP